MSKSFLTFKEVPAPGKTKIFEVVNGQVLGKIKWWAAWRRYTFQPLANTVWDVNCLIEINNFITRLMEDRKKAKNEE